MLNRYFILVFLCIAPLCMASQLESYLPKINIVHEKSGVEGVDCIYVINLQNRLKKWQKVQSLFQIYGLKPNRVNAVNGWKMDETELKQIVGRYNLWMNPGQIGCFLSHLSVWKDAIERQFDCVWVCEDDIQMDRNPKEISELVDSLTKIDPNWDVLYTDLDTKYPEREKKNPIEDALNWRPPKINRDRVNDKLCKTGFRWGMYSMLISKKGLKKIYQNMMSVPICAPVDLEIHLIPYIQQYSVIKSVVSVDMSGGISDTSSNPKKKKKY